MNATTPTVVATELTVARGGRVALTVESLALGAGVTALIGPNGSGKSTFLHAVAGLLPPAGGELLVLGRPPGTERARVAYVLQAQRTPAHLPVTVREVVALGRAARLGPFRRRRPVDDDAVAAALDRLELTTLADRHLTELSGGQRQRVLVAQGLAQDAEVLLLDEPMAGLDLASVDRIRAAIAGERERGRVVLVATHDLADATDADTAVLLAGHVVAAGPPDAVLTPAHLRQAYGGRLLDLGGTLVALDDSHHHDHGPL